MIGIYCFKNKINGKRYIGQSVDIEKRKNQHFYSARNEKAQDYNFQFHQALRKYGKENFDFEILQEFKEIDKEKLNESEKYYIQKFNSFKTGYNMTTGGEGAEQNLNSNEKNGKAKLKLEDVIEIREAYNRRERKRDVYSLYKDRIGLSGFSKIWTFKTWRNILPEYHTKENIAWHNSEGKSLTGEQASLNAGKISAEQVHEIRELSKSNLTNSEIKTKLKLEIGTNEIRRIRKNERFKNI